MAYRFKIDEPIGSGVRRVACEQAARAGRELEAASGAAVHESRKAIKRLRALLRLIRPEIGEKAFKARNAAMREIAAALSGPRDQGILLETVAKLEARYGAETAGILAPVRDLIGADAAGSQASIGRAAIEQVRGLLAREEKRFETLEIAGDGFTVLADGLEQSYRRGRKALAKARENPSDQAYHDLRKAVQWHWRQMAVLSRAWPS